MPNLKLSRGMTFVLIGVAVIALGYLGMQKMQNVSYQAIIVPAWLLMAVIIGGYGVLLVVGALFERDLEIKTVALSLILIFTAYLLGATVEPAIQIKGVTWEKPNFLIIPEGTAEAPIVAPTNPEEPPPPPSEDVPENTPSETKRSPAMPM